MFLLPKINRMTTINNARTHLTVLPASTIGFFPYGLCSGSRRERSTSHRLHALASSMSIAKKWRTAAS